MGYELDDRGSIPERSNIFSLLQSVRTESGAHQAAYLTGIGCSFLGSMRSECAADHSPSSSAEVKNGEAIHPLLLAKG
jgi:hypothetical protein